MEYDGAMAGVVLPESLTGKSVHMVGIKGAGMAALAEILVSGGAQVTGSDTTERFYTDELLQAAGIRYSEGFAASNVPEETGLVIHSIAYDPTTHAELRTAVDRNVPLLTYPQALGELSRSMPSVAIAGVHGKTTTTALCAALVRASGLEGTVLAGSSLADLGGRGTLVQGARFFVAETCEYRRSFLSFRPSVIVVTSIEADHLDYFADEDDVLVAFKEFAQGLPQGGEIIYCEDDDGARRLACEMAKDRPDLVTTAYGETATGEGRVQILSSDPGELKFTVGRQPFAIHVPGRHSALNAAAAILATDRAARIGRINTPSAEFGALAREAIAQFRGTRRRSQVVDEVGGVLVVDDYAHHPTAITTTLAGFREFYPGRRIVLDFMSHTHSRTKALMDDFGKALAAADVLILHEIYASARERNDTDVDGAQLAQAASAHGAREIHFVPKVMEALPVAKAIVRSGDLFVTMGAGNNWELGRALVDSLQNREIAS
jgi:UDP-N-acetylmuramate--alanine ligase